MTANIEGCISAITPPPDVDLSDRRVIYEIVCEDDGVRVHAETKSVHLISLGANTFEVKFKGECAVISRYKVSVDIFWERDQLSWISRLLRLLNWVGETWVAFRNYQPKDGIASSGPEDDIVYPLQAGAGGSIKITRSSEVDEIRMRYMSAREVARTAIRAVEQHQEQKFSWHTTAY